MAGGESGEEPVRVQHGGAPVQGQWESDMSVGLVVRDE